MLRDSISKNRIVTEDYFTKNLLWDKAFGWKKFNVKGLLNEWVKQPLSNCGLLIRAEDDLGHNMIVLPDGPEEDQEYVRCV